MKNFKKYNSLLIYCLILIVLLIILALYPRKVEHAIFLKYQGDYSVFYIGDKMKKYKIPDSNLSKYEVINFKHNLFSNFNIEKLTPIKERIMTKNSDKYELEMQGLKLLSKKRYYYSMGKNRELALSNASLLIIGKNNVSSYIDSKGKLKTFIIHPVDYDYMRVGLSTTNFNSLYHENMLIECPEPCTVFSKTEDINANLNKNSSILVERSGDKINIKYNTTTLSFKNRVYIKGQNLTVKTINRGSPNFNPSYNGILEITPHEKGLRLVNEVLLEDYLTKVVPSEMPAYSALESLKCQSIAARTYAISDMLSNRFEDSGFYVDDSTKSQVYNNIKTYPKTNEAVSSTKGIIMTYKDKPIDAKYYSSSAGTGVNFSDIWFNADGSSENKPYLSTENYMIPKGNLPSSEKEWLDFYKNTELKAIDSASPYFRWKIEFPKETLENNLNKSLKLIFENRKDFIKIRDKKDKKQLKKLPILTDLKTIEASKRSLGGNILEIKFIFENAVVYVKNDYNIRSSIRCNKEFNGYDLEIIRYKNEPLKNFNFLPSSFFAMERKDNTFTLYGGGYGHGVGMSQYGAMELGKLGYDYIQILNTFYKNISLNKIN